MWAAKDGVCCLDPQPFFQADHPFHFFIRDNTTSTILFMGRIADPTESENELTPTVDRTVKPLGPDFDNDDLVQEIVSGSNDSRFEVTGNDAVDQRDLTRWRERAIDPRDLNALAPRWQNVSSVSRRAIAALEASTSTKHEEPEMLWPTLVDDSLTTW